MARRGASPQVQELHRSAVSEFIGTAMLLAVVVGSGIMAERLSGGNPALALLANALATGAGLFALITALGPLSGAHFNPLVTLACAARGMLPKRRVPAYILAQLLGAFAGVALAHGMFGLPVFSASDHERSGIAQLLAEAAATFGLLAVIFSTARHRPRAAAAAVAAYITAAYWFTSSTSFANPAVTLARAASATFAGIRAADAPGFIAAQCVGAVTAAIIFAWLLAPLPAAEISQEQS